MSGSLNIVGLGSGDEGQLPVAVWRMLQQASHDNMLYVRTGDHPALQHIDSERYQSLDHFYERERFVDVYEDIVSFLLERVKSTSGEVVYAVPGHPMVAEATVVELRKRCEREQIPLQILGGESFLDQAFLRFGFDPVDGFQLLDAESFNPAWVRPELHTVIVQVYDSITASEVKLSLMETYPDDYPVVVGQALGVHGQEKIMTLPLYELDRMEYYGNHMMIWVPADDDLSLRNKQMDRLHEIIQILRSPEGCPWDREQTHQSIRNYLIEETYEVLETIDDEDPEHLCEELGDLLLQIMLHAQMEEEEGTFTVFDVIQGLNEKMIRRHPHVFGTQEAGGANQVLDNWQAIKDKEKRAQGLDPDERSILEGVPRGLPALMKAAELQKRAAKVGFDWEKIDEVVAKVEEELEEWKQTLSGPDHRTTSQTEEEFGDLLFSLVNASRFLQIDPEGALAKTNRKFQKRFSYIEEQLRLKGQLIEHTSLLEMEKLWQEAKNV